MSSKVKPHAAPRRTTANKMQDVAALAGVSIASVSRVLTGSRPVTVDVEERVVAAAKELGYQINLTARSLRRQYTGVVGMVIPEITNPYFPALVDAVERSLSERDGVGLMLSNAREQTSVEAQRLASLRSGRVDGVLVTPVDRILSREALVATAKVVPVVQIDRWVDDVALDAVATDQDVSMQLVVTHLASLGHQNVAFVGGPDNETTARARRLAACKWANQLGMTMVASLPGAFTFTHGALAGAALLGGQLPDAIICANDLIAAGVVTALVGQGIGVPERVAVTGMDGTGIQTLPAQTLTTVIQPIQAIAEVAATLLHSRLAGDDSPPVRRLLEPTLAIGSTTTLN